MSDNFEDAVTQAVAFLTCFGQISVEDALDRDCLESTEDLAYYLIRAGFDFGANISFDEVVRATAEARRRMSPTLADCDERG